MSNQDGSCISPCQSEVITINRDGRLETLNKPEADTLELFKERFKDARYYKPENILNDIC